MTRRGPASPKPGGARAAVARGGGFRPGRIDRTQPAPPARYALPAEPAEGLDALWWDPDGPARVLHALNRARVGFYLGQLGDLAGRRVLDAGCGGGLVAKALADAGAEVVGLDLSAGSLRVARRAVGPRLVPAVGSLERLPFAAGAFDAGVAADVLEHVPDLPAAARELARVLRPGGSLVFDTINRTLWAWFAAWWGAERVVRLVPRGTHDWRLFIRPDELGRLLAANGLVAVATVGLAPRVGPATVARGLVRRRIPMPEFVTGPDRRATYLGHYRKVPA